MGMKCDCRADIGSKVGVMWREECRSGEIGREFGEEKVGGFGCGKGVGWRGLRGKGGRVG